MATGLLFVMDVLMVLLLIWREDASGALHDDVAVGVSVSIGVGVMVDVGPVSVAVGSSVGVNV